MKRSQMRMPHSALALVALLLSLCVLTIGSAARVQAQSPDDDAISDTARAIKFYHQGNFPVAIDRLRVIVEKRPDDADAWCYLGLAFNSQGLMRNSLPAFEQCVRLRPDSADAHAKLAFCINFRRPFEKSLSNSAARS